MHNQQRNLESLISNPGFEHLSQNILIHLDKKTLLAMRLVNNSSRDFLNKPRFWLNKMNYKNGGSMELHKAWISLIQKVEDENLDLEQNIARHLIKLVDNSEMKRKLFPLNVISMYGDLHLVKFIIKNNMVENLSRTCDKGWMPIFYATQKGHFEIVKNLIKCTDNPNYSDKKRRTPISIAAANGHTEIVKSLIECTDNANIPNNRGDTPIHLAASYGHIEIVKALIRCSDNPNVPNFDGDTPIHFAIKNGHIETFKALIGCTDNPNAPNNLGYTPMNVALQYQQNSYTFDEISKIMSSFTKKYYIKAQNGSFIGLKTNDDLCTNIYF